MRSKSASCIFPRNAALRVKIQTNPFNLQWGAQLYGPAFLESESGGAPVSWNPDSNPNPQFILSMNYNPKKNPVALFSEYIVRQRFSEIDLDVNHASR